MSGIVALALRMSARRLIEDATLAGARVFDSAIAPIDEMIAKDPAPAIVISTEDEKFNVAGRDVVGTAGTIELVFEIVVASYVQQTIEVAGGEVQTALDVVIPATDAGFEITLSLISRQIMRALTYKGSAPSIWFDVFKRLAPSIKSIASRRGAGSKDSTKFAARQIVITVDAVAEPDFGAEPEPGTSIAAFLVAVDADAELRQLAPMLRAVIVGDDIPTWRRTASELGLLDVEAAGLGTMPAIIPPEDPSAVTAVEVAGLGVVDEATADEQVP
ncbi:hypothetical protein SAMN05892877_13234 [Rhizobium subbaraonis]|uniref:Uncharacterized protein n=1 Tax=Rhizobium subbaraonis TaxID=908946 RepID=A0A285V0W3_9HYPH|nr:hypothetical protein [Rhizobium subbaraonis]SOC47700.1 hypothetical protein SAMN05892877_13234 [Rhizobium subbaraonis]